MSTPTHISYPKPDWTRALTNNSTCVTFPSLANTITEPVKVDSSAAPTTNKYVGTCSGSTLLISPFCVADNSQFHMRVSLIRKIGVPNGSTLLPIWTFYRTGVFLCTAGALPGVAGSILLDTERQCDTITEVATDTWDDSIVSVLSRTDDFPGLIKITTLGWQMFQVDFDMDAGGGTDTAGCNFLFAFA